MPACMVLYAGCVVPVAGCGIAVCLLRACLHDHLGSASYASGTVLLGACYMLACALFQAGYIVLGAGLVVSLCDCCMPACMVRYAGCSVLCAASRVAACLLLGSVLYAGCTVVYAY